MASVAHSTPHRKLPVRVIATQPVAPIPPAIVPIQKERRVYPLCLMLGKAGRDSRFCLKTRLLLALQQDYGATFADWTPALTAKDLARRLACKPRTMRDALADLRAGGYVERHYVYTGCGRNSGTYQYRLVAPRPGWRGIGDL